MGLGQGLILRGMWSRDGRAVRSQPTAGTLREAAQVMGPRRRAKPRRTGTVS